MHIVSSSRPVTEGRLIKRLQTRGGMRWPGWGRRRCGAVFPFRRFKPRGPGVHAARRGAPDGIPSEARRERKTRAKPPTVESRRAINEPGRRTDYRRGTRGADLKHRARDALGLGGLAVYRTSACLDAARRRGPWVRAPCLRTPRRLVCAQDPKRPARPRFLSRAAARPPKPVGRRRKTANATRACPGPTPRTRAMVHAWREDRAV